MSLEGLNLQFKLENSANLSRTQVYRVPVPLPDDADGVTPTQLLNDGYHLQLVGGAATKYPTSWTVMSTWYSGRVKWAGAYIGPLAISASTSITVQLIKDATVVVPAFVAHPNVTGAGFQSWVRDRLGAVPSTEGNYYFIDFADGNDPGYYREEIMESNAHMRTVRRRGYHSPVGGGTGMEANIGRDFLSCTAYITTYTNSRFAEIELRLGNDYRGQDEFTTAPTDYGDPNRNLYPLGPVAFRSWLFIWTNTACDVKWEGKQSTAATVGGVMHRNAYLMYDESVAGSTSTQYLIDDNISKGEHTDFEFTVDGRTHIQDGSNNCRKAQVFFNGGSPSATELNTWAAMTNFYTNSGHSMHAVPKLATINRTRAHGVMEGTYAITSYKTPATQTLWTEEEIHDVWRRRLTAYMTGVQDFPWTTVEASSRTAVRGSSGTFGSAELGVTESGAGGQNRAATDACCLAYISQSWECVQTYYLQAIATATRPGKIFWNLLTTYNRAGTLSGQSGAIKFETGTRGGPNAPPISYAENGGSGSPRQLNRRFRKGFAMGTVFIMQNTNAGVVTSSSTMIGPNAGWPTQVNDFGNFSAGLYRIFIRGDSAIRTVTAWVNNNAFIMDGNFTGPTGTYEYALANDPNPSHASQNIEITKYSTSPSGVQTYIRHRAGMGRNTDGDSWPTMFWYNGEDYAHYTTNLAFEVWQMTGSWMCWDIARHASVAALCLVRDDFGIHQLRTNAWIPKAWLMGYEATNYLGATSRASDVGGLADQFKAAALHRYDTMHNSWSYKGGAGGLNGVGYQEPGRSVARGCVFSDDPALWSTGVRTQDYGAITGTDRSTFSDAFGFSDGRLYSVSPLVRLGGYHAATSWQVAWVSAIEWAWWRTLRDDADARVAYIKLQAEWLADFLYDYALTWDPNNPVQFTPSSFQYSADAAWQPHNTTQTNTLYGGPGKPNIKNWIRLAYNGSVPGVDGTIEALAGLGISHPTIGNPEKCIPDPTLVNNAGLQEPGDDASTGSYAAGDERNWHVPDKLQAYHMYGNGETDGAGYGIASFCAPAFGFSYRYNSDVTKRALHGAIIKAWIDKFREDGQRSGNREQTPTGFTENHAVSRRFYLTSSGDYPFNVTSDTIGVGVQTVTITQLDPTLVIDIFVDVDPQVIEVDQQSITITTDADVIIGPSPLDITITAVDPTVTGGATVFLAPQSITIEQLDPTLFISADTQVVTISQLDPLVNAEGINVFPGVQTISITQPIPGVNDDNQNLGTQSITITQLSAIINGTAILQGLVSDEIDVGSDWVIPYQVTVDGLPVDISSATEIEWALADDENSDAFIYKTLGAGIERIDNGVDGRFNVYGDPIDTVSRGYAKPYFEVAVTMDGSTIRVRSGIMTLRPTILV